MPFSHAFEDKYLNQTRDIVLSATSDIDCTVLLFGSRARGSYRRSSDIDVGFCGISDTLFFKVRDTVLANLEESLIPHHVDLVNFDAAPHDFSAVAMKKVIVWKQSSHAN